MQLHIRREETEKGLVFKKTYFVVHGSISGSREEIEAVKKLDLWRRRIIRPYQINDKGPIYHLNVNEAFEGNTKKGCWSDTIQGADVLESAIKEQAGSISRQVKNLLERGGSSDKEEVTEL